VFFAAGQKRLRIPHQSTANMSHRAMLALFRVDVGGTGDSFSLVSFNGTDGSVTSRQPAITYNPSADHVNVSWRTPGGNNLISFVVPEDKTLWHAIVSRRTRDFHYASINGRANNSETGPYGESAVPMADWSLFRDYASEPTGLVGSPASGREAAIDTLAIISGELSREDAERFMGWAMWKRGQQHRLPDEHPYRHRPPYVPAPTYQFIESTPAQYQATRDYWTNEPVAAAHKGTPVPPEAHGYQLVWRDEFDRFSVTNESTGRGKWFSPVHPAATGAARVVQAGTNPDDPTLGTPRYNSSQDPETYVHDPVAGTMSIVMQKDGRGRWSSGVFCSVNSSGHGKAWMYPYVEARMRIGPSDSPDPVKRWQGAWPALWLESINMINNRAESYVEYDAYEGYISDRKGHHHAYHNHDAQFVQPGRLRRSRGMSDYVDVTRAGNWSPTLPSATGLFDGEWHTYGVMVTPEWVINLFDGKEVRRIPTPIEMEQPLWVLLDLAMHPDEGGKADGVYKLEIDYVRVYQNPNHPGFDP